MIDNKRFSNFVGDQRGVTAVEYGLIAGLIAVSIIVVMTAMSGDLINMFNQISSALQNGSS